KVFESGLNTDGFVYKIFVAPNWLHYEIYLFALCLTVIVVVTYFTKPPIKEKLIGLTFAYSTPEQRAETRASWNKWDVINSVVILSVIVLFYIYFWK
ncbi:MAG: Na+/glucose cotransporter, partial [Bacteroidetes bacterium]|nr:Na+/glucose cotransporter [Bacteroidota bacterium]